MRNITTNWMFDKTIDKTKSRLSEKSFVLFIQYPPDDVSDPKTGRCALTNQRSPGYPLGTDLSNYAQRNVTCG